MWAPALVQHHIDYTAWASRRLLEAAAGLSPEQIHRDFLTADHSVLGTLHHIYVADQTWIKRLLGHPPAVPGATGPTLEHLQSAWPAVQTGWREWAARQSAESLAQSLTYRDGKGHLHERPYWQIALHVVNHATHHRGQVVGFIRAMGLTPPALDLMVYYRGLR